MAVKELCQGWILVRRLLKLWLVYYIHAPLVGVRLFRSRRLSGL